MTSVVLQFVLYAAGMALLTVAALHLALRPWRRSVGAHWTERARLLWPARRAVLGLAFGMIGTSALGAFFYDRLPWLDPRGMIGVSLGFLIGTYSLTRQVEPRYHFLAWLWQALVALLVQGGLFGILGVLYILMPQTLGAVDWLRVALGLLAYFVVATGAWLPIFKLLPHKKTAEEARLEALVAQVARETGLRPRWLFYSESPTARAAALVYLRSLYFTSRVMEILDDEELRAVLHHEFSHLREGLGVRLSRLLPLAGFALPIFIKPVFHHFGLGGVAALLACSGLCSRLQSLIARRMEQQADAAAIQGADAAKYARALEKFHQVNQMPAVMRSRRMVHPHLYDRMLHAGVTPDYPRPAPPGPMAWPGWVALALPVVLGLGLHLTTPAEPARRPSRPPRSAPAPAVTP